MVIRPAQRERGTKAVVQVRGGHCAVATRSGCAMGRASMQWWVSGGGRAPARWRTAGTRICMVVPVCHRRRLCRVLYSRRGPDVTAMRQVCGLAALVGAGSLDDQPGVGAHAQNIGLTHCAVVQSLIQVLERREEDQKTRGDRVKVTYVKLSSTVIVIEVH